MQHYDDDEPGLSLRARLAMTGWIGTGLAGLLAAAMKAKLAKSRAKGRGGWDDPNVCSVEFLAQLLVEHLGKGNAGTFEDVANLAMMLHQRGADPKVLAEAAEAPIKKARGEALELGVRALESKTAPQPEQTEQQPVATWMGTDWNAQQQLIAHLCKLEPGTDLYAAPIAQTGPATDCEWCAGAKHDHYGDKCPHCQATPHPRQSGLVEALADAAQSLETISNGAGKDEFMQDMADVRGYARSRAGIARAALSAQGERK